MTTTSVTKANISAVKVIGEHDARLSAKEIGSCIYILKSSIHLPNVWV
jgi:hypothetical protein